MKNFLILLALLLSSCATKNPIYEVLEDTPASLRDRSYFEESSKPKIVYANDLEGFLRLFVFFNNNDYHELSSTTQRFAAKDQEEATRLALEVNKQKKYQSAVILIGDETEVARKYEQIDVGQEKYFVAFLAKKKE